MDRREFLKWTGAMAVGLMASGLQTGCKPAANRNESEGRLPAHIQVPDWTGDSFPPMHRVRDAGEMSVPPPSRSVDVLIVGAGLSGLTAAYRLRNENVLVLERESRPGGNAKMGEYRGVPYALGSAYLVDIGEPYGPLYSELGLKLNPIGEPADLGRSGEDWAPMEKVHADFDKLKNHFKQLLAHPDFPASNIRQATPGMLKLDRISFAEYLKGLDISPEMLAYVDAYCYSALGGGLAEISAYAGVNFYSEIAGPVYAFPGGNAAVAQRLSDGFLKAGAGRILTNVAVYRVAPKGDRVHVSYFRNDHPEQFETIEAKMAVIATPYFFASRVLRGLPQPALQTMRSLRYGSYLVANACFERPVMQGGYDHWTPGNPAFTDFIIADYAGGKRQRTVSQEKSPFVLSVYAPFRNVGMGRGMLLQGNREMLAGRILEGLRRVLTFDLKDLSEMHLTRYGHQLLTSRTGLMNTLAGFQPAFDRIILAHSDGMGMAAIEGAVLEGLSAAKHVSSLLRRA